MCPEQQKVHGMTDIGQIQAPHHVGNIQRWIEDTVRPNAFVTILMPVSRTPRPHEFYLSVWTRHAEATLWGKSALHVSNYHDRCLWFFVHETINDQGKGLKLHHYHALLRMPGFSYAYKGTRRPMLEERRIGRMLPLPGRCLRMQDALAAATKKTPEPFRTNGNLRTADITVLPYRPEHAPYVFKQLKPWYREHWIERTEGTPLQEHGLFILPHLPARSRREVVRPSL